MNALQRSEPATSCIRTTAPSRSNSHLRQVRCLLLVLLFFLSSTACVGGALLIAEANRNPLGLTPHSAPAPARIQARNQFLWAGCDACCASVQRRAAATDSIGPGQLLACAHVQVGHTHPTWPV